jgi:ABC-type glycerol-3-phosphate transport system permease component
MVLSYTTSPAYHLIAERMTPRIGRSSTKAITCRSRWRASWRPATSPIWQKPSWPSRRGPDFQSVIPRRTGCIRRPMAPCPRGSRRPAGEILADAGRGRPGQYATRRWRNGRRRWRDRRPGARLRGWLVPRPWARWPGAPGGLALSPADLGGAALYAAAGGAVGGLVSVALAVPVARALARRRFPGRALLITLMGAPFLLPVIVAVLGLLAVFGRGGVLNTGLAGGWACRRCRSTGCRAWCWRMSS